MRVGLDIGGTKTEAVVLDDRGEIIARVRRPTGWGPDGVVETIRVIVAEVAQRGDLPRSAVSSVGIGLPGQVQDGHVSHAVNLGIEHLALEKVAQRALGVAVRIENDVKAAAWGASALLAARGEEGGSRSLAYVNLGTGIAAGFVLDGRLHRGSGGIAGEIGHLSVDPAGPLCRCGQRGCIEALAGGGAVAARWGKAVELPVLDVFDAADGGDPVALHVRADLARGVAAAVRTIVLALDVDTVILGGGIAALRERLLDRVVAELSESAATSAFLRSLALARRVELLPSGSPAAAFGAALVGADAHTADQRAMRAAHTTGDVKTAGPAEGEAVTSG